MISAHSLLRADFAERTLLDELQVLFPKLEDALLKLRADHLKRGDLTGKLLDFIAQKRLQVRWKALAARSAWLV